MFKLFLAICFLVILVHVQKDVEMTMRSSSPLTLQTALVNKLPIIHLIRDPRGIESSRLKIHKRWRLEADTTATCERLLSNALKGSGIYRETSWLTNHYLRIRYEDLALDPLGVANKIYNFVGLSMVPSVEIWIKQNTHFSASVGPKRSNPYSTKRDSSEAMQAWRKHLTFAQVEYIQNVCSKAMAYFGYRNATSQQELLDFNTSLSS